MLHLTRRRALAALGLLFGCQPQRPGLISLFPAEVTVYVSVTDQVAQSDHGNVAAMVDAIEADLRSEGRRVDIVAARGDERPPLPRLELQVTNSTSGNASERGAAHLLVGVPSVPIGAVGTGLAVDSLGHMQVDAFVVGSDGKPPRYLGRFRASSFMATSEESVAAGERVGHDVVARLLHEAPARSPSGSR